MISLTCGTKEGEMKRPVLALAAALLGVAILATAATAARPQQFKDTFSDTFVSPAGERCDFDYQISFTLTFHDIVFGDPENPDRVISHGTAEVAHTNLDTGYTLTEVDRSTFFLNLAKNEGKVVGIQWKLRTPEGKLVFVRVGQVRFTLDEEMTIKITPHLLPEDTAPIVCALLGGHAA
jgi:hypothetical protein